LVLVAVQFLASRPSRYLHALCGEGILKLLTAKAAKKFRQVREEERALLNCTITKTIGAWNVTWARDMLPVSK
jgi:hypothetical protein